MDNNESTEGNNHYASSGGKSNPQPEGACSSENECQVCMGTLPVEYKDYDIFLYTSLGCADHKIYLRPKMGEEKCYYVCHRHHIAMKMHLCEKDIKVPVEEVTLNMVKTFCSEFQLDVQGQELDAYALEVSKVLFHRDEKVLGCEKKLEESKTKLRACGENASDELQKLREAKKKYRKAESEYRKALDERCRAMKEHFKAKDEHCTANEEHAKAAEEYSKAIGNLIRLHREHKES